MTTPVNDFTPKGEFLRAEELARRLNISRSSAYRLMRETIPVVRLGPGIVRVRLSDLEAYLKAAVDDHSGES